MGRTPEYRDQGRRLRQIARDRRTLVFYRPHAERRMQERGVEKTTVERIMKAGSVVNVELHSEEERWTAQGRDADGQRIEVVVVVSEDDLEIEVATVLTE